MQTSPDIGQKDLIICLHDTCLVHSDKTFSTKAEFHRHVRKDHKDTPFQCPMLGCTKFGADGWFRRQDRVIHQRKAHPFFGDDQLSVLNDSKDMEIPAYLAEYK